MAIAPLDTVGVIALKYFEHIVLLHNIQEARHTLVLCFWPLMR